MDTTTNVLNSDFLHFRLLHIHDVAQANTHREANRSVPFILVTDDKLHNPDYGDFWQRLAHAIMLCGAEVSANGQPKFWMQ